MNVKGSSLRVDRIRDVLDGAPHHTEYYAAAGRCSLGEAVVALLRLERAGEVRRGSGWRGMTWQGGASTEKQA